MSFFGRILRFSLRPAIRVGEQFEESSKRLKALRQQHEQRILERQARAAELSQIADPAVLFEQLYEERGWTPQSLQAQLVAVRRTKTAALIGALVGTIAGVVILLRAPLWMMMFLAPAVAGVTALGLVAALKFGLFQAQIEQRRLLDLREYLCRADLFAHVLGRTSRSPGGQ